MAATSTIQPIITRTERGLTVFGTRITLYDIMDYVIAGWTAQQIRDILPSLTEAQVLGALEYIEANREVVEAEYHNVLEKAEETRAYWEERNRERFSRIAAMPPPPDKEALYAKLADWKARQQQEK